MKTYCSFFLVLLVCLLIRTDSSQAQQVTFNRVSLPEVSYFGLVNGISQDPQGYMWFAAYFSGLHRYDGYHSVTYLNDPLKPSSLASNNLEAVYADHNGIIWAGTEQSGLDRLDPKTGIFTHFRHKKNDSTSLSDDRVTAILEDYEGTLWVGTKNGLNRLDQKKGIFTRYMQSHVDPSSLSCNQVQVLYEDKRHTLWIGTSGYNNNDSSLKTEGGLNRINKKTGKFTSYLHNSNDPRSLLDNRIGAILEDSKGTFWVATAREGLHIMDREKGIFERYIYDAAHPEKLSGPPRRKSADLNLNLFFLAEDITGAIWIGASAGLITRYNPKTKKTTHYNSFNDGTQSMHTVSGAFTSREGILWIRTWIGKIYTVNPLQGTIQHFNAGSIVHAIHEDASGNMWLGTFLDGLIKIDRTNGTIKRFSSGTSGLSNFNERNVDALYEENDSTLWIGSEKGLSRYNTKTKMFTHFVNDPKNENSLSEGGVVDIIEDKPGLLWIATGNGLDLFDIKKGIFTHYRNNPKDSNSLSHNELTSLLKDRYGNLWIGTHRGTLNLFDHRTGKFKHFLLSGEIGSTAEDSEGTIWVGTTNGLYRSNAVIDSFARFQYLRIAMTTTTIVPAILEDNQKNLWIASTAGILRFAPNRSEISIYNKNQGVDASGFAFFLMRGVRGRHGEFFFSNNTGFYSFFPDEFKTNTTPPQIVISDFRLANVLVKPGKGNVLTAPLTQTKKINLKYNQDTFSFDFAAIHFSSPEDNQHFYMMENLDNTWRKAPPEKRAYYYNVPPGHYIFRVKAANSDGVWAEKAIDVIVNPPWYQTWWAYALYIVTFLTALWSFIKWREKVLRKEKILLEEKVAIRTLELQEEKEKVETTLTELKATQEQLIQAEKKQAVLNERLRISRELHDEVGGTLSSISIFSQAAIQKNESGNVSDSKNILEKIGETSREVMGELNDTVWLINPLNDNLQKIIQRISNYALPLCSTRDIRFEIKNALMENPALSIENRKAVYLIMKEAVNNSLKYASAKSLVIQLEKKCESLHISIKDDGRGFAESNSFIGNGLNNMKQRAKEVNGEININSSPQKGTEIILQVLLTNIGD